MAILSGKSGILKLAPHGGIVTEIIGVRSWDIDAKCDAVDITGMDSSGAKAFTNGITEWSATAEVFLDTTDTQILDEIREGIVVDGEFYASDDIMLSGTAIITGCKPTVGVDGAVAVSLTLQGDGELS